jgi:HAE1 family hydrophobic/amphiphilic exporter-1
MTALATIFALTPMALGITGHGGFISQPLAIVVIGGLLTSTVLTLVIVPVLYRLTEGRGERRAQRKAVARLEAVIADREARGTDTASARAELERIKAGGGAARVAETDDDDEEAPAEESATSSPDDGAAATAAAAPGTGAGSGDGSADGGAPRRRGKHDAV